MFQSEWVSTMLSEFTASALLVVAGFVVGRSRERRRLKGKDLHQYGLYPYVATPEKFAEFSPKDFRLGVHYPLRNADWLIAHGTYLDPSEFWQLRPEAAPDGHRVAVAFCPPTVTSTVRPHWPLATTSKRTMPLLPAMSVLTVRSST